MSEEENNEMNETALTNLSINDSFGLSTSRSEQPREERQEFTYTSALRVNQHVYGPNTATDKLTITNHFDDIIFRAFECNGPLGRYSRPNRIIDLAEIELAERCEGISLDTMIDNNVKTEQSFNATEDLRHSSQPSRTETSFIRFGPKESLLKHLPVNLLAHSSSGITIGVSKPPAVNSLFSVLSQIKSIPVKPRRKPLVKTDHLEPSTPNSLAASASKKRAPNDEDKTTEIRSSKKRIIQQVDEKQPQTPKSSRTILHYFTPKSAAL